MAKTQTKTKKTTTSTTSKTTKKTAKPVEKKTVKTTAKAQPKEVKKTTKVAPAKSVQKKSTPKKKPATKKEPIKTVTVTFDEPAIVTPIESVSVVLPQAETPLKPATRNILQLYFDNWINMFSFTGRAGRAEFIAFWSIAILLFPIFVPYAIFSANLSYAVIIASALLIGALFTLSIRRAHDIGRNGFWGALLFVTVFGILSTLASLPQFTIIYIFSIFGYFILSLISGTKGVNKYGEEPVKPSKLAIAINTLLAFSLVFTGVKLVQLLVIFFQGY